MKDAPQPEEGRSPLWLKVVVSIAVIAAAASILFRAYTSPQALHAPVWVIWLVAALAILAPLAIFVPGRDRKRGLFWCAVFFSTLAVLLCWTAFGPGERNFVVSRTLSFGPVATSSEGSELEGRIFFGLCAIGFVIASAWMWRKWRAFGKEAPVPKEPAPASGWHRHPGHHRRKKRRG